MASVNVELKARDPDPDGHGRALPRRRRGRRGMLRQRDTYFAARRGRLKLRVEEGALGGELIAYRRDDAAEAAESGYVLAPTAAPEELAEALDAALGTVVVVSKRRRLFLWEGVRIHLDEVDDLGTLRGIRGRAPGRGRPRDRPGQGGAVAGLAGDRRRRAGVGRVRGSADGRARRRCSGRADAAMRNAYAPYSEFKVGAAVRGAERRDLRRRERRERRLPAGPCAEASALGALVTAGETAITAVAVVAERLERLPAVRGLPAAAGRVRRGRDAGVPRAAGSSRVRPWASCCPGRSDAGRSSVNLGRAARRRRARVGPRRGRRCGGGPGRGRLRGAARLSAADRRGHAGRAVLGRIGGVPVAVLQGRAHLYEGGSLDALRAPVRALRAAGASVLVLTNAAGSLRPEVGPGSLMAITDHINMTGVNLLAGPNDDSIGPRFPSLRDAYDPALLASLRASAARAGDCARRGRVPGGQRAELRDAGRDPRLPRDGRRRGRDVDGPGDDRRPPLRPAGRRRVGDHEPRRGHDRRAASATSRRSARRRTAPATSPGCCSTSSRGSPADPMLTAELIRRKRDGVELSAEEIASLVSGIADGTVTDAQVGALAMAIVWRGMSAAERVALTGAMTRSGDVLDWSDAGLSGPVLDKHSTGGVGDKVSLLLAPIVAACGAFVPMISGRGPRAHGRHARQARVDPGVRGRRRRPIGCARSVARVGCAIVGQTGSPRAGRPPAVRDPRRHRDRRVDPADRRLDPVEEARRRARRAGDGRQVRLGRDAAVARTRARELAQAIVEVAVGNGLPTVALLTDMNQVLGRTAGNAVEVRESIDHLTGAAAR